MMAKQVIGGPVVINGRTLSLSRAVRAGEMVYLTGQVPMRDGAVMIGGSIEDQTRAVLDDIAATLALAGCGLEDVVKSMVWLTSRDDFPGFNAVYAEYFPHDPPGALGGGQRSAGRCEDRDRGDRLSSPDPHPEPDQP